MTVKSLVAIAIVLLLTILAAVTNPDQDDHMSEIKRECTREASGPLNAVACSGIIGLGGLFGAFEFEDNTVFSRLSLDGAFFSIGAFGRVWIYTDETADPSSP